MGQEVHFEGTMREYIQGRCRARIWAESSEGHPGSSGSQNMVLLGTMDGDGLWEHMDVKESGGTNHAGRTNFVGRVELGMGCGHWKIF